MTAAQSGGTLETFRDQLVGLYNGTATFGIGDVDGDGADDILRSFYVTSGMTGNTIYSIAPPPIIENYGLWVEPLGDMDGDGIEDFLLGDPGEGYSAWLGTVYLHSGVDGSLIRSHTGVTPGFEYGHRGRRIGDLNGDGVDEYMIDMLAAHPNDQVFLFLYSGIDGALLRTHAGELNGLKYFMQRGAIGDVDLDGSADYILHAWDSGDWVGARILSGADGSMIRQHLGAGELSLGAGDVDQDGYPDYYLSIPSPGWWLTYSLWSVSGKDGSMLREIRNTPPHQGQVLSQVGLEEVALVGDQDGDGVEDLLIGNPSYRYCCATTFGRFMLHSGATGYELYDSIGPGRELEGNSVSSGDFDGDGREELLVTSVFDSTFAQGRVTLYNYTSHLRASHVTIAASVGAVVDLHVDFGFQHAWDEYKILCSSGVAYPTTYGVQVPLTDGPIFSATRQGLYPFPLQSGMQGSLDAFGSAVATFLLPARQYYAVVGKTFWFAAVAMPHSGLPVISSAAIPIEIVF